MIGIRADGTKELFALADGFRESSQSWADLLRDCKRAGSGGGGFDDVRVLGIEGPAWTVVDPPGDDADQRFDSALRCARLTENYVEIADASAHLMAIATVA